MAVYSSYGALARKFRTGAEDAHEAAVATIRRVVHVEGPRVVQEEIARISPQPVDRGTYKRSWKVDDIPDGAVIYNFSKHAGVIELGRRPGSKPPPVSVIEAWVLRKKIVRGRGARARKEARGIAFVIARAIGKRGLPAHYVLRAASRRLDRMVQGAIMKGGERH